MNFLKLAGWSSGSPLHRKRPCSFRNCWDSPPPPHPQSHYGVPSKVGVNTRIRDGRITERKIPFTLPDGGVEPHFRLPPAPLGDEHGWIPWKNRRGKKECGTALMVFAGLACLRPVCPLSSETGMWVSELISVNKACSGPHYSRSRHEITAFTESAS